MVFFSGVYPIDPIGWKNTRILDNGKLTTSGQEVTDPLFWEYMRDSALSIAQSMNNLSDKQKRKLDNRKKTAPPVWKIRQARSKHKSVQHKGRPNNSL
jgi:hypothetical protein